MYLLSSCVSCKDQIPLKSKVKTKTDLLNVKGETFSVSCPNCERLQAKSPTDFIAFPSYKNSIISLGITAFIAGALWPSIGALGACLFFIPLILITIEFNKAKSFNEMPLFD